jgi:hypothetical protein
MDTYTCPKGHRSSEADFCSECGAKIQPGSAPAATASPQTCPDCGAPRTADGSIFCEVCGYNYQTRAHGEIPIAAPPPTTPIPVPLVAVPPPELPAPAGAQAAAQVAAPAVAAAVAAVAAVPAPAPGWSILIEIDPSLREPGTPEPPAGVGPFTYHLDKPATLIGRRSKPRAIFPEISLDFDDAVSHRHALLERDDAGALALRDIGASNGTRLNGKDVTPMTDIPLKDGDTVTLGYWTRLTVKAVS